LKKFNIPKEVGGRGKKRSPAEVVLVKGRKKERTVSSPLKDKSGNDTKNRSWVGI